MVLGREEKVPQLKLTAVQYGILAVFLILAYGLWRLQVMGAEKYAGMAEKNRIRTVPMLAPRGKILDREGRIIVDNYPSFSALLLRDQARTIEADVEKIASGLHMLPDEVRARLKKFKYRPQYEPIILKDDITPDELAFIESHKNELPELDTIMSHRRLYPKNGFMAHLIGYVGEVSEEMLNQSQWEFYNSGDVVGKSGVELSYNDMLMGKNGYRRAIVNSRGKEVGRLDETPATPGKQLKLTIDIDVQIAAEQALGDRNGAVIAMDPRTGEVLALVSRPTFDPNEFAVRISRDEWTRLVTDEAKPLLNKAIQAQLAPGSVFKIVLATAGLQEGVAQSMHVNCGGGKNFYGRFFKCWVQAEHRSHGEVGIQKAIYQSCDSFFYTLGDRLGIGRIAKYATMYGLGQKTGIDLPQEVTGVFPSAEWKAKLFKQKWYAGETISVSIGQGAVATTPAQLMRALGGIAMGGKLMRPHVAFPEQLPPNFVQAHASNVPDKVTLEMDPANWETITDAMAEVINPIGTAPSAHLNNIDFAGKTGSSQTISNVGKARLKGNTRKFRDNGWFVGFTPRRNPEIVVATLIEQGEHGYMAARLVAQVIKAYVEKQRKREQVQTQVAQAETQSVPPAPLASKAPPVFDRFTPGTGANQAVISVGLSASKAALPNASETQAPAGEAPALKSKPKPVPSPAETTRIQPTQDSVEVSGFAGGENDLQGQKFRVPLQPRPQPTAKAAPGMN
jgi:penicillin-binding protein 2